MGWNDQTLVVKRRKKSPKINFFHKEIIKKRIANATSGGALKAAWANLIRFVLTLLKFTFFYSLLYIIRMAHASTHGARKPPGPILVEKFVSGDIVKMDRQG